MKKCLFLLLFVQSSLVYAQWPQWRGPMRDGFSPETNLLKTWPAEGPELVWSCNTIGDGFSSAVIQDKKIYITGKRGAARIMTAMDLNGKMIWERKIGDVNDPNDLGECSTPTLYEDKLYTFTKPGDVYCVDANSGKVYWSVNIPEKFGGESHVCESPLVVDDKVIVSPFGEKTTIIALNRVTGETIWQSEHVDDKTAYVSPILIQGRSKKIVVTNGRKYVLAVDSGSGNIIWRGEISSESFVPVANNHQVYIPSCMMVNINPEMGRVNTRWQDDEKVKVFGGAVKLGSRIFGTYENGSGIFCLNWQTGRRLAVNNEIKGANLLAADGMVYSYEENSGRVSLLKPIGRNIEIVSSFEVKLGGGEHLAHMSIGNGILFIRHGNTLMAYDIKQTQSLAKIVP